MPLHAYSTRRQRHTERRHSTTTRLARSRRTACTVATVRHAHPIVAPPGATDRCRVARAAGVPTPPRTARCQQTKREQNTHDGTRARARRYKKDSTGERGREAATARYPPTPRRAPRPTEQGQSLAVGRAAALLGETAAPPPAAKHKRRSTRAQASQPRARGAGGKGPWPRVIDPYERLRGAATALVGPYIR